MLSLRALKHFSVLAEERHFSRAAARLHLTQSALTRSIQGLEDTLGVKLLDRSASGAQITKSGEAVLHHAHRVLAEASALERRTAQIRDLESGEVSMGAGVFPAAGFMPSLLEQLTCDYPGIALHVEIESWQRLAEMLEQDKLDFVVAITHSLPPSSEFSLRPLPPQHAGLFVRPGHPLLALNRRALPAALPGYRLAATHLPPKARAQLASLYKVRVDELPLALQCNSVESLRAVTLRSDVVLFCMREAILDEIAGRRLVQLPLAYQAQNELSCNIVHHARRTLSPAALKVISMIEQLMRDGLPRLSG